MNVLLVNPTFYTSGSLGTSFGEPLGLAYIAAAIEQEKNHHVDVVDSVGLSNTFEKINGKTRIGLPVDELISRIGEKDPDIIGMSFITSIHADEMVDILQRIKKVQPGIPIVVGGAHVTLEYQKCIGEDCIDIIVLGEGEKTIVELLNALQDKKDLSTVRGIVFKNGAGDVVCTQEREPVDIEQLPLPARHLFPMKNYLKNRPSHYYMRNPVASLITSRACPFHCIFCSTTLLWGRRYRARSPKKVVDEIEMLQKDYGVREFLINDDSFTADKKRAMAICDEIIARKLDIRYQIPPGVNLHLLDDELLVKFKNSGLYILNAQFETGNPKTVKYIRKPINLEKGRFVIDKANKLGMWTKTNIIIGFPEETKEDIETTIQFVENLKVDNVFFLLPIVFFHTDLGKDYIKKGLIEANLANARTCDSLHLTLESLEALRHQAMVRFQLARLKRFLNPFYVLFEFLPKINSPEKFYHFIRRIWYGAAKK
jgi:anaerobic magnesium-protoporphyrin IX monomethyl ester cyclase